MSVKTLDSRSSRVFCWSLGGFGFSFRAEFVVPAKQTEPKFYSRSPLILESPFLSIFNQNSLFFGKAPAVFCVSLTAQQEYLSLSLSRRGRDDCLTYHLLNRASQKCSFDKSSSTHSPFPNVRAYIHTHLHRDSFHCHFTPFIGSVWTPLPPLAGTPAGVWLYERDWTMRLQYPNPHPPTLNASLHSCCPSPASSSPEVLA